ncbi:MAG: ATP-binding protein [Sandaracinaceae bacterium]|nr:ATP-binding protein [Sandaracinaceae bacterium]
MTAAADRGEAPSRGLALVSTVHRSASDVAPSSATSAPVAIKVARAIIARAASVEGDAVEAAALRRFRDEQPEPDPLSLPEMLERSSDPFDVALLRLRSCLGLSIAELVAVALAADVEHEPLVGRALAWLQDPIGRARPTLGLIASSLGGEGELVERLATGGAVSSGLLCLDESSAPLPERAISIPTHVLLALRGLPARVAGARASLLERDRIELPRSLLAECERYAQGLREGGRALVVRSGHAGEARAVATAVVLALGKEPLYIEGEQAPGLVPWLLVADRVPVFVRRMAPGERLVLEALEGWEGPALVAAGPDGSVETLRGTALSWSIPVPAAAERAGLWQRAIGDAALAQELAHTHRHGAGRIAELARLARHHAAMGSRGSIAQEDVQSAAWQGDGGGLSSLAQAIADRIDDEALVLTPPVRRELELLLSRCRQREALAEGLGIAACTRYRTGVRALLVGPSGTGKTLAVSWLATKLAMPLYRVDMASVLSKYIGETERNLAELLARAESSEVVLFFDEADALFGKRTEVRHSTDRFANAQTNYLLQRIETYDGVVVLASNSRTRFDPAFSRRLDHVVEFPTPGPEERRDLWIAHLGERHALSARDLNKLAVSCDLAGGHVRNAVLAAAVIAREDGRSIEWNDVVTGLALEHRKLGLSMPAGLERRRAP